jgi:hypothetical protein
MLLELCGQRAGEYGNGDHNDTGNQIYRSGKVNGEKWECEGVIDGYRTEKGGKDTIEISFGKEGHKKHREHKDCGDMLLHIKDILKEQTEDKSKKQRTQCNENAFYMGSDLRHGITFFQSYCLLYNI